MNLAQQQREPGNGPHAEWIIHSNKSIHTSQRCKIAVFASSSAAGNKADTVKGKA
jgi:hypothetical protein